MSVDTRLPAHWDRLRAPLLLAGVAGLAVSGIGYAVNPEQFFRSYLTGYLFWFGLAFGSLGILMLHHVAYGIWGFAIRRELESAAMTLPLMAVLFLPIVLGVVTHQLYPWSDPAAVARSELLRHKALYLNPTGFQVRAAAYFGLWSLLAFLMNRWSLHQDRTDDPKDSTRLKTISGPGLVLFVLTGTLAMVDWVMSLEPEWYSSIYGVMLMAGQILSTFALMVIVAVRLSGPEARTPLATTQQLNDLGNLMLAFVMLWAYMSFSQFLIIWAGNLAEEIPWYLRRMRNGWQWIALALILTQFWLPFLILIVRDNKRSPRMMARVAALILGMHLVEVYWLVAPVPSVAAMHAAEAAESTAADSEKAEGEPPVAEPASTADVDHVPTGVPVVPLRVHWIDPAAVIGLGGLWLTAFLWQLKGKPLLPLHDPQFGHEGPEGGYS